MIRKIRKALVAIPIAALMIAQLVITSAATTSPAPAFADVDLSPESRVLTGYLAELIRFDREGAELAEKASLTRAEFAAYERQGEALKRRLAEFQGAVRSAIDKLKAAGQFDGLNQTISSQMKTDDPSYIIIRSEGGAKTLMEQIAEVRGINVNEILRPLEILRNKVQGRAQDQDLASRVIRVSYSREPVFGASLRCRLAVTAYLTALLVPGNLGEDRLRNAVSCYCNGNQGACNAL